MSKILAQVSGAIYLKSKVSTSLPFFPIFFKLLSFKISTVRFSVTWVTHRLDFRPEEHESWGFHNNYIATHCVIPSLGDIQLPGAYLWWSGYEVNRVPSITKTVKLWNCNSVASNKQKKFQRHSSNSQSQKPEFLEADSDAWKTTNRLYAAICL